MKDENKQQVWKTLLKSYRYFVMTYEEIWFERLEEVKQFIDINKNDYHLIVIIMIEEYLENGWI